VRRLQMHGNRVVHRRSGCRPPAARPAWRRAATNARRTRDTRAALRPLDRHRRCPVPGKCARVVRRPRPARLGPRFQVAQLDAKDGALNAVHPVVEPLHAVLVAALLAPAPHHRIFFASAGSLVTTAPPSP
jgi:hypothetical protein